jgi:alpha-1,6-mannosyltransferase
MLRRPHFFLFLPDLFDVIIFVQVVAYIIIVPYTKVEESFNTQASYDLIHSSSIVSTTPQKLSSFDHFEFPGVVPRTFLGPSLLATIAAPIYALLSRIFPAGILDFQIGEIGLIVTRVVLGFFAVFAQAFFRRCIRENFDDGKRVSNMYALVTMCQFHLLFYASRPLPNSFALILVWFAMGYWIRNQPSYMFAILAFSAVLFRSDILVLAAPIALITVITRQISIFKGALIGLFSMIFGILLSVVIDSYFWGRLVWAEGEVLYFNTIMNKSSDWGTEPYHWYFTSALPRSLLGTVLFIPLGVNKKTLSYLVAALCFIALYSLLPHKELRFVLIAVPLFNLVSAVGLSKIRRTSIVMFVLALVPLAASFAVTMLILLISKQNYPGAHALKQLHNLPGGDLKYVHMDADTCMTGVTRFVQLQSPLWKYSKEEINFNYDDFTHVLTGNNRTVPTNFEQIFSQDGYDHLDRRNMQIVTTPKIFAFKKKTLVASPSTAASGETLSPVVKWAQRTDKIYLTVELFESKNVQVLLTIDNRHLLFKADSRGKSYALDLHMHGSLQPFVNKEQQVHVGTRWIKIVLLKSPSDSHFWPRLLADKNAKPPYLRIDWDNWVEDEADETMKREESWFDIKIEPSKLSEKTLNLTGGHGTTLSFLKDVMGEHMFNNTEQEFTRFRTMLNDRIEPYDFAVLVSLFIFMIAIILHATAYEKSKQKKE